jgi:hypothetical protein
VAIANGKFNSVPIGPFGVRSARVFGVALTLMAAGAAAEPAARHQFSADIVTRDATGKVTGGARLHVADRRVRIDTTEAAAGFFLIDGATGTALFVRPDQRVFMDAKRSTPLTQIFVPVDSDHPCRAWQASAQRADVPEAGGNWLCARIDAASTGGHATIEYDVISPDRSQSRRWIDPQLAFPIKVRVADGTTIALEHLRMEPQPQSLFAVPPSFHKLDPQALIDRIKQSDVWAGGN